MPIDHIHALPPGTRFEEYRLDAVLGAGGFGITYRAYDAHLDKFVAIKEYLPGEFATRTAASTVVPKSNTDAEVYHWGLTRFLDEARTLARFDHTHLNKVHRFFESNGTAYMVLEYINGETLADRLSREPYLEEADLQRLLDEVLSGLAVMHEAGYVHRDIKPGNLMLREEDGSAVVLDFGAARQAVGQRSKPITSILTPGYAPVEQYDGKVDRVGPWTDIYALGMVAYRCISGMGDSELPDAVARMLAHTKGGTTLLTAVEAGKGRYNPKLLEAIDWAMAVDEEDRPQGVDAWRQALAGGSRRKSPPKSVRKPAVQPARGTTTARTGMSWSSIALTLVIVALVGAVTWLGWQMYPELFGQGPGDAPKVTEQEAPVEVPSETPQEAETGETGEALAGAEQTPPPVNEEIEQPLTKEPVLSAEEAEVARLLAAAAADLKARRLTSPVGNNAWEKYQEVLKLDSGNPEAVAGMEQVIGSYMELFGTAVEQEAFGKADGYLSRIRDLHPDSPVLEAGEQRLEAARQARADRLAAARAALERQRQAAEEKARQYGVEMVAIPGGTFRMGDLTGGGDDSERPVHSVTVPDFKLGKFEVTFAQWDACVADGGCGRYTPDDRGWGRGNRPVIRVSWDEIQLFIAWLNARTGGNYRLPTEAEWEYAARAGSTTIYSWGNSIGSNRANCDGCGSRWDDDRTAPVGSFSANAWGLHDLHGNVWEWVQDCDNDSYVGAPTDGSAWTSGDCGGRVNRGGSWFHYPHYLRSAYRSTGSRSDRYGTLGFRLAQDK